MNRTPWYWIVAVVVGAVVVLTPLVYLGVRMILPARWDNNAITATFDRVGFDMNGATIIFEYTLHNHTNFDYKREIGADVQFVPAWTREAEAPPEIGPPQIDFPLVVPANGQGPLKIRAPILAMSDRNQVLQSVLTKLNDFVVRDSESHYLIALPRGW